MTLIGTDIQRAAEILSQCGIVAIPTETVYGLAANAVDPIAVSRIFEVKKRPSFDPLIVHLGPRMKIDEFVIDIPTQAELLIEKYWPGPLTLVLPKKKLIPHLVTSGLDTVGLRMPDHAVTQKLLNLLDFPLAAPSANLFGRVSPTSPSHVLEQLGNEVDYILDGGPCDVGIESTIIGWEENIPVIYRLGGLEWEQIEELIGPVKRRTTSSSKPSAPGMLINHYSPKVKLVVGNPLDTELLDPTIACLRFSSKLNGFPNERQWILSENKDLKEAAKNLFRLLRELDNFSFSKVYVELAPEQGLGLAINDRLIRASAPK